MDRRRQLGAKGEKLALSFLLAKGYKLVCRNYRCRSGELDLVMRDGGQLVFVEVRSKSSLAYGSGFESITGKKCTKLRQVAQHFLSYKGLKGEDLRFDVVSVLAPAEGPVAIEHLKEAF